MTFNYAAYQLELRDAVYNALTASPSILGTYTFEGGLTTPAIKLDDGTVLPDDLVKPEVTGLEAVIQPYIQIPLVPELGEAYQLQVQVRVTLKQWDITQRTIEGFERLRVLDYLVENPVMVPRNPSIDSIETLSFLFISYWDYE